VKLGAPERQIFFLVKEIDIIVLDKHTHSIECKKKQTALLENNKFFTTDVLSFFNFYILICFSD
jgi:hypothetical protein